MTKLLWKTSKKVYRSKILITQIFMLLIPLLKPFFISTIILWDISNLLKVTVTVAIIDSFRLDNYINGYIFTGSLKKEFLTQVSNFMFWNVLNPILQNFFFLIFWKKEWTPLLRFFILKKFVWFFCVYVCFHFFSEVH